MGDKSLIVDATKRGTVAIGPPIETGR